MQNSRPFFSDPSSTTAAVYRSYSTSETKREKSVVLHSAVDPRGANVSFAARCIWSCFLSRAILNEEDWSKTLIHWRLIESTWKIVEVSIYSTYTDLTKKTDAFDQSASVIRSIVFSTNMSIQKQKKRRRVSSATDVSILINPNDE